MLKEGCVRIPQHSANGLRLWSHHLSAVARTPVSCVCGEIGKCKISGSLWGPTFGFWAPFITLHLGAITPCSPALMSLGQNIKQRSGKRQVRKSQSWGVATEKVFVLYFMVVVFVKIAAFPLQFFSEAPPSEAHKSPFLNFRSTCF